MAGVRIVTDSSCDLSAEEAAALGVEIVPLSIRFGNEEYVDREELSVEDFYAKLRTSDSLPETAAPSPGAFLERFNKLRSEGADAVVCINISRDLSATMEAAHQAARQLAGEFDVRVIDSRSITAGLGTQVIHAAEAARAGASADEIVDLVAALVKRTHVLGSLDTLEYLKKGGRIGGAQALIGSMLSIKPILDISSGAVEEAGKQRTRKKALLTMRDRMLESGPISDLAVYHADAKDLDDFIAMVREVLPDTPMRVGLIGAVIGTHGGPGTMGVCWLSG
jgi:DegV family protein with EDD domain